MFTVCLLRLAQRTKEAPLPLPSVLHVIFVVSKAIASFFSLHLAPHFFILFTGKSKSNFSRPSPEKWWKWNSRTQKFENNEIRFLSVRKRSSAEEWERENSFTEFYCVMKACIVSNQHIGIKNGTATRAMCFLVYYTGFNANRQMIGNVIEKW